MIDAVETRLALRHTTRAHHAWIARAIRRTDECQASDIAAEKFEVVALVRKRKQK